jgi:hypothetical protein
MGVSRQKAAENRERISPNGDSRLASHPFAALIGRVLLSEPLTARRLGACAVSLGYLA